MEVEVPAKAIWRWRWLLWVVAVASTAAASWVSVLVVAFVDGRTCDGVATRANRDNGLLGLLVALVVVSTPWVVVTLNSRTRWRRLVLGWLLGVGLILGFATTHLTVASWSSVSGGFCF